jgi:hypothetical protein
MGVGNSASYRVTFIDSSRDFTEKVIDCPLSFFFKDVLCRSVVFQGAAEVHLVQYDDVKAT